MISTAFVFTGLPNTAKFSSASRGQWRDSYNISWAVESLSPIVEYKLLFRRLPDTPLTSEDGHPQPLHHQSQKKIFPMRVNALKNYALQYLLIFFVLLIRRIELIPVIWEEVSDVHSSTVDMSGGM